MEMFYRRILEKMCFTLMVNVFVLLGNQEWLNERMGLRSDLNCVADFDRMV